MKNNSGPEFSFRVTGPIFSVSMQRNGPRSLKIIIQLEIQMKIKKCTHDTHLETSYMF